MANANKTIVKLKRINFFNKLNRKKIEKKNDSTGY